MLRVIEENNKIYSHIRKKWLSKTPEEIIRQQYLCALVNDYGYDLRQIKEEENLTGRGSAQARADFVIYSHLEDLKANNNPLIIVECKAEHIVITEKEFLQGELYARIYNAPFFVTHNGKETKFWRVKKDKSPGYREEIENIPSANANEKEIKALYSKLKVFREKEFKQVLDTCHNIIRNNEKLDAAAAFDEIAKILFMKVYAERHLRKGNENVFSLQWVEEAEKYTRDFIQTTFDHTKTEFGRSVIFKKEERINLKEETIKSIIQRFERYNLSETSVDTKGIAFEGFLGTTFRGDLGQFFTPRPVVDFMIDMLDPQEGETVLDPACGSGGFLIRFFQKVQENILAKINAEYQASKKKVEGNAHLNEIEKEEKILLLFEELEQEINIQNKSSRLFHLANNCIFGTDANERMARIAKMNMIMHGDGHGGIHHHDGFINTANIEEEKFDIILSNPPFGLTIAENHILKNFQMPKSDSIKAENLFLERCIQLLKPKGRMAMVITDGTANNPSLDFVREFVTDKAKIEAVISLPEDIFKSAKANVKTSLLFIRKFSETEQIAWETLLKTEKDKVFNAQKLEREAIHVILEQKTSPKSPNSEALKTEKEVGRKRLKELDKLVQAAGRQQAKNLFDYPIFMAMVENAGITSTGDVGSHVQNELPFILHEFVKYKNQPTA